MLLELFLWWGVSCLVQTILGTLFSPGGLTGIFARVPAIDQDL